MRRLLLLGLLAGCEHVFGLTPPPDAAPPADGCYGTFVEVCTKEAPAERMYTVDATIDSDGDAACAGLERGPDVCLLLATTLTIPSGVRVRGTGARPLVIVATQAVTIDGELTVASYLPGDGGAAAGNGACTAGTPPSASGGSGGVGAGGAGGSFVTMGGVGRRGRLQNDTTPGNQSNPGAAQPLPTTLRGGCGGMAGAGVAAAKGGDGGGAIAVIAPIIGVAGRLDASGSPGAGGASNRDGGGGGGSGGMIVLEATTIAVTGSVLANGGAGGEGATAMNPGTDGRLSPSWSIAPDGGAGSLGGDGGDGAFLDKEAEAGRSPNDATMGGPHHAGGGGGGGGAGVIYVVPFQPIAQVSPTPQAVP